MNISVATTKHYDKNNKQPATNVIKTNPNKAKVNMGKIDRMQSTGCLTAKTDVRIQKFTRLRWDIKQKLARRQCGG
jgi:hypothetical protein